MSASEIADIIDLRFGFEKGKRFPPSLPLSDEIDFEALGYVKVYDCDKKTFRRSSSSFDIMKLELLT